MLNTRLIQKDKILFYRFVSLFTIFSLFVGMMFTGFSAFAAGKTKVIVHYHPDPSSSYDWNLWIWGDGLDGKGYPFTGEDDFGKVAEITFDKDFSQLGVIVRTDDWVKDTDGDRFIPINNGVGEVWLIGGDTKLYTEKPAIDAPPARTAKPGEAIVSIHYFRPDGNYSNWYLAVKSSSQAVQYAPFKPAEKNGALAEATLTNVAADANIMYDIIQVTDPQLIDKKPLTELKFQQEGSTVYASNWNATYGVVERFHVQSDPQVYAKADQIPTKARFLKAYLTDLNQIHILGNGGTTGGTDPTAMSVQVNGIDVELQSVTASSLDQTANWTLQLKNDLDITAPIQVVSPTFGTIAVEPGQLWYSNRFLATFNSSNQEFGLTIKDGKAILRAWVPLANAVSIEVFDNDATNFGAATMLTPVGQGIWQADLDGSIIGKFYRFNASIQGKNVIWTDPFAKALNITGDRALFTDPAKKPQLEELSEAKSNAATIIKPHRYSLFSFDVNTFSNPFDANAVFEEAQKLVNESHASGTKVYVDLSLDTLKKAAKLGWEQSNPGIALDSQRLINYNQAHIQSWMTQVINHWIGNWKLDGIIIREWAQLDPGFQKQLLSAVQAANPNAVIVDYLEMKSESTEKESTETVPVESESTETSTNPWAILIFAMLLIAAIVYVVLREFGTEPPNNH